jgi:hypothetical protein
MRIAEFAAILKKSGSRITKIGDHYFNLHLRKSYSVPPCNRITITRKLISILRWKYPISVLLTDLPWKNTYEFVLETNNYSLDLFSRKVRNRIRKSLKNCRFMRPSKEELLTKGLEIYWQTCERQGRIAKEFVSKQKWTRIVDALYSHEDIQIQGAYYHERMVGYMVVAKIEDKYCMQYAFIDRKDSEITSPMNGILYTFVNEIIKREGKIKISYGLDSMKPLPELNRYKMNMLFNKIPVTRVYIINPLLMPYYKIVVFLYIVILKRRHIDKDHLRRIVRIYHGNRILKRSMGIIEI